MGLVVQNEEYFLLIPSHFLILPFFTTCTYFPLLCQELDSRASSPLVISAVPGTEYSPRLAVVV